MPKEGEILSMICLSIGISPGTYLTTRTRKEFEFDAKGLLKSKLLVVEIVSNIFGSSEGSKDQERVTQQSFDGELIKAGPEMSDEQAISWAHRERRSSKAYPWLKKSNRRNYNVVNLDTRNAEEFMKGIKSFG